MRKDNQLFTASLALLLAGFLLCVDLNTTEQAATSVTDRKEYSDKNNYDVHSFAIGPGIVNLSPGDEYSTYQWGLKNDGEFQLIELTSKFQEVDSAYQGTGDLSQITGPGAYVSSVTKAITGVDINILPAWELYSQAQLKRQVVIALIDTGVDTGHTELQNSIWINTDEIAGDGIDNDGNGYIDDINGWNFFQNNNIVYEGSDDSHGTHSAGTIAATKDNHGITGITDNNIVKIMPLKALGGPSGMGTTAAVIQAIQYAEANGASICNLSLGTSVYDEALAATIQNSNMLFIIAAGNGDRQTGIGYNTDFNPVYPASLPYDNVISVANLLFDGNLSKSSNWGTTSVDIAAPGSYIVSTIPGNNFGFMSGTSMAAPMVTGVAAMIYSFHPDFTLADVKTSILNSSRKLESLSGKTVTGGMLDAFAALSYPKG